MSGTAIFDCGAGDAYASKILSASSKYTVDVAVTVPAATFTALVGHSFATAALFYLGSYSGNGTGLGGDFTSSWQLTNQWQESLSPAGALTADVETVLRGVYTYISGHNWSVDWFQDGTPLGTTSSVSLDQDDSTAMPLLIGGVLSAGITGEVYKVTSVTVKDASDTVVFSDDFSSGDFTTGGWTTHGDATVDAPEESSFADSTETEGGAGGVRIGIAFDDPTLEVSPTWTYITALDDVIAASYTIDRGKQDEEEQVGAADVVVNVFDKASVLDPTNVDGPYYGKIVPLLQMQIERWNPDAAEWRTRCRCFIQDLDYVPYPGSDVDPAGIVRGFTSLQITGAGIMEPCSAIQMQIGQFGDTPPAGAEGFVFYDNADGQDRFTQVMGNAGIPDEWFVCFTLNIEMAESTYSPGDTILSPLQDVADAELPTVANLYEDRFGRLCCHGRKAVFDPIDVAASASPGTWDFEFWKVGDGSAVAVSISDTAQFRAFANNLGKDFIVNSAFCTPVGITQTDKAAQLYTDPTSIGKYGIRSWPSRENLFIESGTLTGNDAKTETFLYAKFVVENRKDPKNRIKTLTFKSMRPDDPRAAANWDLLSRVDVSHVVSVTTTFAGQDTDAPSMNDDRFLVEAVHENVSPLTGEYAMVELSLDVTPLPTEFVGLDTPAS